MTNINSNLSNTSNSNINNSLPLITLTAAISLALNACSPSLDYVTLSADITLYDQSTQNKTSLEEHFNSKSRQDQDPSYTCFDDMQSNTVYPIQIVLWQTWCPTCVDEIPELNNNNSSYLSVTSIIPAVDNENLNNQTIPNINQELDNIESTIGTSIEYAVFQSTNNSYVNFLEDLDCKDEIMAFPSFLFIDGYGKITCMSNYQIDGINKDVACGKTNIFSEQ